MTSAPLPDAGQNWVDRHAPEGLKPWLKLGRFDRPAGIWLLMLPGWQGIALAGAMFVGRLLGDRLVDRFGERTVVRAGGVIVAVGMGAALAYPAVVPTVAGFAAAGLGMATVVPAAMHAADRLPGLRPGSGLTVVAWLMRLGFVAAPPIVGLIADAAGLRVALLLVPAAGVVAVLLCGALSARQHPVRSSAPPP